MALSNGSLLNVTGTFSHFVKSGFTRIVQGSFLAGVVLWLSSPNVLLASDMNDHCAWSDDLYCLSESMNMEPPVSDPVVTVRFADPVFDCTTLEYCVDVEFKCNMANLRLFGMNVRFIYEAYKLSFVDFRSFEPGYAMVAPAPPSLNYLSSPTWYQKFDFEGPAYYANGSIKLTSTSAPPVYMPTDDFVRIFQICFTPVEPVTDPDNFCPAIIWDEKLQGGGYFGGEGVEMTVYLNGSEVSSAEVIQQYNWEYTGNGVSTPYGLRTPVECINIGCGPNLVLPPNITITCSQNTNPSVTGQATATSPCQQGSITLTYADNTTGACPDPNLITRTWTATDGCGSVISGDQYISRGPTCLTTINQASGNTQGTLQNALDCALPGSQLNFSTGLNGGTITISQKKVIGKDLVIKSTLSNGLTIQGTGQTLFEILPGSHVVFEGVSQTNPLIIISGTGEAGSNNNGAAFDNKGILELKNVKIFKNTSLPANKFIINNKPESELVLIGNNYIEVN